MPPDIDDLLNQLRANGGDSTTVEVKSAEGGLPTSIGASLSALANLPGGGILLLGLSEEEGFAPVGLRDPQTLKQSLGAKARSLAPPVQLSISDATVGGEAVIVAEVAECDPTLKPCRLSPNGKAFVRSYDGDFEISEQEVQGFLVRRGTPRADRLAVPGTTTADLDMEVVEAWRQVLRANHDPLSKFEGDELFRRSGIIGPQGELTRAGLLTFGLYPQQHLPRFTLHVTSRLTTADNQRAVNTKFINGPIPTMLADAMEWLQVNVPTSIVTHPDGTVRDEYAFPMEALRELVANALVHRDLATWSESLAVELVLERDKFIIANPGGLFGITVDRLGREHITSARNQMLVQLNANARDPRTGARVVEALSDGLRTVVRLASERGFPPVLFQDTGIAFRVIMSNCATAQRAARTPVPAEVTTAVGLHLPAVGTGIRRVYDLLLHGGPVTVEHVARTLDMSQGTARSHLNRLRKSPYELVDASGGRGKITTYAIR